MFFKVSKFKEDVFEIVDIVYECISIEVSYMDRGLFVVCFDLFKVFCIIMVCIISFNRIFLDGFLVLG